MTDFTTIEAYGVLTAPATLRMERLLPGPIERIWDYLTRSEMRRLWLASGEMELKAGAPFELIWRNDELTDPPTRRASGEPHEHRQQCRIIAADPPRMLAFQFGPNGDVTFTLEPKGADVLLTMLHERIPNRDTLLGVSAGWHQHLDTLVARVNGQPVPDYWEGKDRLSKEYAARFPG